MDAKKEAARIWEEAHTEAGRKAGQELEERFNAGETIRTVELGQEDVWEVLNAAYIARRFFNKSRSWLGHKLRHDLVNGKRSDFTLEERERLKSAFETLSGELQDLADRM